MSIGRTILVALVAFSVAMLPVAGAMARGVSPATSLTTAEDDCCPHGKPCEKKTSDDCGSVAGCALKCFNFFGTMVSGVTVRPTLPAEIEPWLASLGVLRNSTAPPLPPPRV
jgi:hypothetical protein